MQLDLRSVAVGYAIATVQMSAELADLRAGIEAALAALKSELAAARADLHAARAELENFRTLRAADGAAKSELARRCTLTDAAAAQRLPSPR